MMSSGPMQPICSDGILGAYSLANLLAVLSTGGGVGQTPAKVDNCIETIFSGFIRNSAIEKLHQWLETYTNFKY